MGKIRVAVVGLGFGRYGLVPAFRLDPRCEVVAVCGTSREHATEAARNLGVPSAYGDFREMIERGDVDAVAVATPPAVQPEIAALALSRGKAVFVEKPLALSVASARRLNEAAEEAGVANVVDFIFPEIEAWRHARRLLEAGAVGSLRHANLQWLMQSYDNRHGLETWKTDPNLGGGALQHFGSHVLYYLEWFLGPMSELRASLAKAADIARPGDTHVTLAAIFRTGVSASVVLSSAAFMGSGHSLEFYGSDGAVVLRNETGDHVRGFRLLVGARSANELAEVCCADVPLPAGVDGRVGPVSGLARRFLDWIETGVPTTPSFREGLRVQTLLAAARASDETGKTVSIPADDDAS